MWISVTSIMTSRAVLLLLLIILIQHESDGWRRRRRRRRQPPPCRPANCQVGHWSQWSGCTHRCGYSGTQSRGRNKLSPASCGGQCPYHLSERRACNRDACRNGGTPAAANCKCKAGFTGTCCEIVIPTKAPTTEPTKAPTAAPTTAPTTEPSTAPTTEPTTVPTTAQTTAPTTEPTTVPTTAQTTAPTTKPTKVPTTAPTIAPTTAATTALTTAPTTEAQTTSATVAPTSKPDSVSPSCDGGYLPHTKCRRTYIKIGAFKEKSKARAMPVLLLTDRDCFSDANDGHQLDWHKFEESIHSLACRCAKLAKQNHWKVFGLQNYGECWSGPGAAETFHSHGKGGPHDSVQILTNSTAQCDKNNPQECIGKDDINYVYRLQ